MAEQLNMNGLSLKDSSHASQGAAPQQQNGFGGQERSAYIPPHMRASGRGPPPAAAGPGAMNGNAAYPPPGG